MTSWLPLLTSGESPVYIELANQIEQSISNGTLVPNEKLPPQRNLAFDLGITTGTVGRAYKLAIERGLVAAETGRGTFVLNDRAYQPPARQKNIAPSEINPREMETGTPFTRMNSTRPRDIGQATEIQKHLFDISSEQPGRMVDYVRKLEPSWQYAGQDWLSTAGWVPPFESIVPTHGAHTALLSIIATVTKPGDRIAFEGLTYADLARALALIGRRVVRVNMGENGIDPDHFASICAQLHPKVLVTIPTIHNPTTAILPLEDRLKISDTAARYNVTIVEDNVYGKMVTDAPKPYAELLPNNTFHVGGLSKSVSSGIRSAWISCPPKFRQRILATNKALTGGQSYLISEMAARLVNTGAALKFATENAQDCFLRHEMVCEAFSELTFYSNPVAPFIWLKLEEPWLSGPFTSAARSRGVLIGSAEEFIVDQTGSIVPFVRVAFSYPQTTADLSECLRILKDLMLDGQGDYAEYC